MRSSTFFPVTLATAAWLAACGGTSSVRSELSSCALLQGTYKTVAVREAVDGTCPWAKQESHDRISFDDRGALELPVAGVARCHTTQADCQLHVSCTSDLFGGVQGELSARVAPDGQSFEGHAIARGDFQGCHRVDYQVAASR